MGSEQHGPDFGIDVAESTRAAAGTAAVAYVRTTPLAGEHDHLADSEEMVRVTAALIAPADDQDATEILVRALGATKPDGGPCTDGSIADALAAHDLDLTRITEGAETAAGSPLLGDWSAVVRLVFPTPYQSGQPLTATQAGVIRGLVGNQRLWDRLLQYDRSTLPKAGLPSDRQQLRAMVAAGSPDLI
jgi:hypothetical protein